MHFGLVLTSSPGWMGGVVGLAGGGVAILFGFTLASLGWMGAVVGLAVDRGETLLGLVSPGLFCWTDELQDERAMQKRIPTMMTIRVVFIITLSGC